MLGRDDTLTRALRSERARPATAPLDRRAVPPVAPVPGQGDRPRETEPLVAHDPDSNGPAPGPNAVSLRSDLMGPSVDAA